MQSWSTLIRTRTLNYPPWGLSAILIQKSPGQDDRRIVAYIIRALSDVEKRYSQTEKEALAIVWEVQRLHLYGGHFTLSTDCKRLIFGNPKLRPPARIEWWNLKYDYEAKGNSNPSDFLSRYAKTSADESQELAAEEYIHFLASHAVPRMS